MNIKSYLYHLELDISWYVEYERRGDKSSFLVLLPRRSKVLNWSLRIRSGSDAVPAVRAKLSVLGS